MSTKKKQKTTDFSIPSVPIRTKHSDSTVLLYLSIASPGFVRFALSNEGIADLFCSEKRGPLWDASICCRCELCFLVLPPPKLQLEIWATVWVISSSRWQRFGGSAPSCLLTVGLCSANRKHTEPSRCSGSHWALWAKRKAQKWSHSRCSFHTSAENNDRKTVSLEMKHFLFGIIFLQKI